MDFVSGFTLVELLVVISIIGTLLLLSLPLLHSLVNTRGMTKALNDISDLLELARNEAVTSSSYTYVCFENTTNNMGNWELRAFVLISPGGRGMNNGNRRLTGLKQWTAMHKWENLKMVTFNELDEEVRNKRFPGVASKSVVNQRAIEVEAGTLLSGVTSVYALLFSPQGYVIFQPTQGSATPGDFAQNLDVNTPYEKFVDLALFPAKGADLDRSNPDQAALLLNGANGHIQILRR